MAADNKNKNNNSSNSLVFGRWPQTKINLAMTNKATIYNFALYFYNKGHRSVIAFNIALILNLNGSVESERRAELNVDSNFLLYWWHKLERPLPGVVQATATAVGPSKDILNLRTATFIGFFIMWALSGLLRGKFFPFFGTLLDCN